MRGYAHSNRKYLRIIEIHDYRESKTVLTFNDNDEYKGEIICSMLPVPHQRRRTYALCVPIFHICEDGFTFFQLSGTVYGQLNQRSKAKNL